MKRFLSFLLPLFLMFAVSSCEDRNGVDSIKGHTFSTKGKIIIELSFKKDMSVIYSWKNAWSNKKNQRDDLTYTIDTDTTFSIYTQSNDSIWANGRYHYSSNTPFITTDNFRGDTLYLKR